MSGDPEPDTDAYVNVAIPPAGAAYAAGLAVGFWSDLDDLAKNWQEDKRWEPNMDSEERDRLYRNWKKAVTKTFDWVDDDVQ